MKNYQDFVFIAALLLLCLACSEVSADVDAVMSISERDILFDGSDPNHILPDKQILVEHEAFGELVKAYKRSGDENYARRLGVLLYCFSRDFQNNRGSRLKAPVAFEPIDGIEMVLVQAFLAVRDSEASRRLSSQLAVDVVKAIQNDLIQPMVDAVIDEHKVKMTAVDPVDGLDQIYPAYLADIALVGRAIGQTEYIRVAYRYLSENGHYTRSATGEGLTFDMHSNQGQQGHLELVGRIRDIYGAIEGYSDPAGFKDINGQRYDNISMADFPHVKKILFVLEKYALPDGQMNLLGDTRPLKICEPLKASRNALLSGFGHAVLGGGRGADQSQVQLHFGGRQGSGAHRDCLSLVWYAHGRLMSGEIGAQRNYLQGWAECTLSHNTVIVDGQEQRGGDTFGNVVLYATDIKGLSVIQVDGKRAYRHLGVKTYRRTIIHNTIDPKRPYFVDVFEVEGGSRHDYSVHGSVSGDMSVECSLDMQRLEERTALLDEGERTVEPNGVNSSKYRAISNVDTARANQDFTVTFTYKDGTGRGTRIHIPANESMDVFLGHSPALKSGGDNGDGNVYERVMPHLIARRTGEKGLRSRFVAVYDMFEGQADVMSVKRLTALDAYVGLEIDLGGRVDKLLYCPDGKRSMVGGGVQMKGRLGLVTQEDGRKEGYLIGGTILRKSPMMVRMKKALYSGRILTASRKEAGKREPAFTVDTILPTGGELSGKWLIVTHRFEALSAANAPDELQVSRVYQIDHIEREGLKMVVYVKGDHGLEIEEGIAREVYSGWREFDGASNFVIYTTAESLPR